MKLNLKQLTFSLSVALFASLYSSPLLAQEKVKASPPKVTTVNMGGNVITVNYSSPSKKGRKIYGELVPFGEVWRTGANEATTIALTKDGSIGGMAVKAGKYALFTIPGEKNWTIIINSNADQWGAYDYDKAKDIVRFDVASSTLSASTEAFTITGDDSGTLSLIWDKTKVTFTVK